MSKRHFTKAAQFISAACLFSVAATAFGQAPILKGVLVLHKDIMEVQEPPVAVPTRKICGNVLPDSLIATQSSARKGQTAQAVRDALKERGSIVVDIAPQMLDAKQLHAELNKLLGRSINESLTQDIVGITVKQLNERSQYLADVYLPPQTSQDGYLVVVVKAARLGKVVTQGQKFHDAESLACNVRIAAGEAINVDQVAQDVAYLNGASDWRRTEASYQPGDKPGFTDLVLTTIDQDPKRVYVGADNTGTRATGMNRIRTGFNWGNAFGNFDHRLDYALVTSGNFSQMSHHAASYSFPLPNRDKLAIDLKYSKSDLPLASGLYNSSGVNEELGLKWTRQLSTPRGAEGTSAEVFAGVEYKSIGNTLLFGEAVVSDSKPTVLQGYVGLHRAWADGLGRNDMTLRLTGSPGHTIGGNDAATYDTSSSGAKPAYWRANIGLDKAMPLGREWVLQGRFNAQLANQTLIASERMTLSGSSGVRGYYEDTLTADAGAVLSLELQTPRLSLPLAGRTASVQAVAFVDGAYAHSKVATPNSDLNATANSYSLSSHGVGLRANVDANLSFRLDLARRHTGLELDSKNWLMHASMLLAY